MKEHSHFSQGRKRSVCAASAALFVAGLCLTGLSVVARAQGQEDDDGDRFSALIRAEQPPAPCTPNETAVQDVTTVSRRGDVANLPDPLKTRLLQLAARPHTYLPIHAFAEAVNSNGSPKPQSALPILSDRYDSLSAEHLYHENPRHQRPGNANCREPSKLCAPHQRSCALSGRAQARPADRSQRSARLHRRLYGCREPLRHQQ